MLGGGAFFGGFLGGFGTLEFTLLAFRFAVGLALFLGGVGCGTALGGFVCRLLLLFKSFLLAFLLRLFLRGTFLFALVFAGCAILFAAGLALFLGGVGSGASLRGLVCGLLLLFKGLLLTLLLRLFLRRALLFALRLSLFLGGLLRGLSGGAFLRGVVLWGLSFLLAFLLRLFCGGAVCLAFGFAGGFGLFAFLSAHLGGAHLRLGGRSDGFGCHRLFVAFLGK